MHPPGGLAYGSRLGLRAVGAASILVVLSLALLGGAAKQRLPSTLSGPSAGSSVTSTLLRGDDTPRLHVSSFDARQWPAYVINGADAFIQRKWVETQLADLGYTTYERVNSLYLAKDDCFNATGANCQQGLTLAHHHIWQRIVASKDTGALGYLILEDDATFHKHFRTLFPRYASQLPADYQVAYVGQLSRAVLDHDPKSKPLTTLLQSDVAPFTTHAYIVSRAGAAFLANHLEFMLSRSGSPHAKAPFYMNADAGKGYPWGMTALEMKIDFFMILVHRYYYSASGSLTQRPAWFTFESTTAIPAEFGPRGRWAKNTDIELGSKQSGKCAGGQPDALTCEAKLTPGALCGPRSGRMPLMGTGLSFQNKCRKWPFALYAWSGEPERLTPPTCAALRTRIAPSALSEPATVDCMDEGAMALQNPAVAAYFQARDGVSYEDGLRFSTAAVPQPQNWSAFRESVIMPHGSVWLDRAQPAAPITVHGLQCGQPAGRCDLSIWIRPGTTDSAVLGQVIGRNEYGFLIERQLPPPATILDAGANCGIASLLFGSLFPSAQIVSVEPATDNFAALSKNAERFPNIHPVNAALWGEDMALSVVKGARHGREWDNQVKAGAPADENNKNSISGLTVNDLLRTHKLERFDFVKIDIEGSEKQVFEASAEALSWLKQASYVAVELHEDMNKGAWPATFNALAAAGTFCHTSSGEYNVWLNNATTLMRGYCAARAARGQDCCGAPAAR